MRKTRTFLQKEIIAHFYVPLGRIERLDEDSSDFDKSVIIYLIVLS